MKLRGKRLWSVLLCTTMAFTMLPAKVSAATVTTYLDGNGSTQTVAVTVIGNSTTTLTDGWYAVNDTVSTGTLTINGNVKIILTDGASLTVTGNTSKAGIEVSGSNSLTIYGQTNGTGILNTTSGSDSAGIGTSSNNDEYDLTPSGTVNIYGGTVIARGIGSYGGAGIGSKYDGFSGTVNIYGGTVTATGGIGGAGIGGGYFGHSGNVNIYGGMVTATGGTGGAGIGGGYSRNGGSTTIYGGTVTAIGGSRGAGIGGGLNGTGGSCVIAGGSLMTSGMGCTPTNGSGNGSATVYLSKVALENISTATKVTSLTTSAGSYGINSLYTDNSGRLYLWLPNDSVVSAVTTASGGSYVGSVTTASSGTASGTFTLNQAPTDITLSVSSVAENIASGSSFGNLLTADANIGDHFTYSLVSGDGDTDNSAITVSGQELKLKVTPDYESKNSYSFRIRSTDSGGISYEKAFIIMITNVNEAPSITAPATLNANIDSPAAVTGISFTDPDSGSSSVTASFNVTSGTLTATSQSGVIAINSGTTNLSLTGSISNLNAFLAAGNLTFTGTPAESVILSVTINDNGNSGTGGPKTESTTIPILIPAVVTSVSVPADGSYKTGDVLDFTVNFNRVVTVDTSGGTPYLPLIVGNSLVRASYLSGSGTTTLIFRYTVVSGDSDSDGVSLGSSIHLNNGTIQSDAINALLILHSIPRTAGILLDTAPTKVASVIPANSAVNVPVSGTITVTFDKPMSAHAGMVTLTKSSGTPVTLDAAGGSWTGGTIYTISYTGLSYNTDYSITISGFQDMTGNEMTSDTGRSFTTEEEPLTPSVSPKSLTVFKNGSEDITVAFGQGAAAVTGASITVTNNSIASVSTVQVTTPGAITVSGLAVGTTDINIVFHDASSTTETVTVTVLPVAPVWLAGSTLEASKVTSAGAALTWTAAQDSTEVIGYKLYQNGALIATVSGTTTSYEVRGLSASTVYSFQIQAGNADDAWTIGGPTIRITTNADSFGGGSNNTNTPSTDSIVTQPAKRINYPLLVDFDIETSINQKGHAAVNVSITSIEEVIARAKVQGEVENGIAIAVNIDLPDRARSLEVVLSQQVLKSLIDAGVKRFEINSKLVSMSFDLELLKEIHKQSTGDVTLSLTPVVKLSKKVRTLIGDRPVYNMTLSFIKDNKTIKITNFNRGKATLAFPYTLGKDEKPGYLYAVHIDSRGNALRISGSAYVKNEGCIIFTTNRFSIYGIGYMAPGTKFSDTSKHWAKESIDYVVGPQPTLLFYEGGYNGGWQLGTD